MNSPHVGTFLALASAAACALIAAANAENFTLVEAGSEWRYHADGSPPAAAWKELGFDDSGWSTGAAPLGFANAGVITEVATVPTAYFRLTFSLDSTIRDRLRSAYLSVLRDDGVVVYLNGTELQRSNMPEGVVDHDSLATESVGGENEERFFESREPVDLLQEGENVLAVSLHQVTADSSDSSFDLEFIADDLPPYLGSVRPGAAIDFTAPFLEVDPGHAGVLGAGQPNYQGLEYLFIDDGDSLIYQSATDPISGTDLGSKALVLEKGTLAFETGYVDMRGFRNVQAHLDLGAMARELGPNGSSVQATLLILDENGEESAAPWFRLDDLGPHEYEAGSLFVTESSPVRFIVPTAADNPAGDWTKVAYDDSAWLEGLLAIGYERSSADTYDPYIKTDVEEIMYNKNQSIYVRSSFELTAADLAVAGEVFFEVSYEDGFVAWLNGSQIASSNPPTSLSWNSGASQSNADSAAVLFESFSTPQDFSLTEGENILAIQAMNKGITSSDFLIRARLGVLNTVPSTTPPDYPFTRFSSDGDLSDLGSAVAVHISADVGNNSSTSPAIFLDNIHISGDPVTTHSFSSYLELETPFQGTDLDASADGDRDGIANLIEYACGTDAARPDAAEPPAISFDAAGFMHVQIKIRDGAVSGDAETGYRVDDLLYVPELTKRFDRWEDGYGVPPFVQVGEVTPRGDGFATVHLRSRRPLRREEQQAFFRLRVELALPPHIVPPIPDRLFVPQPTP